MKNTIRNLIILGLLIMIAIGIGLIFLFQKGKPEELEQPIPTQVLTPTSTTGQQLSQKEITERKIIESKGEGYPKYALEEGKEKNIVIAVYPSDRMEKSLPLEKRIGPGILVFKIENGEVKKIWESTEEIYLTLPRIEVRDITGDGKNEILVFWSNGKFENLYIYSWTGVDFMNITPFEETGMISVFNADEGYIEVKDIDGDKIEEVIMITARSIGWDEKAAESINEYYRQIYKWNPVKQQYYLWKEETVKASSP